MTDTLEKKLHRCLGGRTVDDEVPPWMAGFGALSDLADENRRVLEAIDMEFESHPREDSA